MIFLDFFVISLLVIAVYTGLRTMHCHQSFFSVFRIAEVLQLKTDALLYILLVMSTALCSIDTFLRCLWISEVGWSNAGTRWAILWLGLHTFYAITATLLHALIGKLLGNDEFCELCRRGL